MTPKINFIGCGKLGKVIAYLIHQHRVGIIEGILTTSLDSAEEAAKFIGRGKACQDFDDLPAADIYFITTPDDKIMPVCESVIHSKNFNCASLVVHCSGALSSQALISAQKKGCGIASIHPIKSIADPLSAIQHFSGTHCALEGDEKAFPLIKNIFEKIGANVFSIDKNSKPLYHAASVIANNYLVTLHHHATECYKSSGVDETTAKQLVSMLMNDALTHLANLTHTPSLTGPLQRGDLKTISQHLHMLNGNPLLKKLYSTLGLATLLLTTHEDPTKSTLENMLK